MKPMSRLFISACAAALLFSQAPALAQVGTPALPVALARGGRGKLPELDMVLRDNDILLISASADGAAELLRRLNSGERK